ncbi:MAG TPA: spore cortex-lytic enzyme [Symbiobacteriaceae bacterium]|jgi:N-acetylmuramoyl-L-alanine amidase
MGRRIASGFLLVVILVAVAFPWAAMAAPRPTLYWGRSGPNVRLAQQRLQAWGYYRGRVDGVYGANMYAAVTWFQRANGLTADGVVGPATWTALGEWSGGGAGPGGRGVTRHDDVQLLAQVVSAEARGEPYEGQVAVAAVLLNRMRDPRFPGTLAGVVYQEAAFESVANGAIYQNPTRNATRAARDALNGWDPSGGAVFFWNPSKPVSPWIWSRQIIRRIGNHVFAR